MRARLVIVVSAVALATAACTGTTPAGSGPGSSGDPVPPETLILGTEAGPLAVRVPTGSVLFERPGAVSTPDRSLVFATTSNGRSTVLETLDGVTGEAVSRTQVAGELDVRVASGSGRAVALMDPLPKGWDPSTPLPRSRTMIVVADPTGAHDPLTYELEGNYEPEAFSTNDQRLFLIQHLPAEAPIVYRVTVLDLRHGDVETVFGPFKGPAERMPGIRLQQVFAPNGSQLYTLYSSARPGYVPHQAPAPSSPIVSFVHVLSLSDGWAHCAGLPKQLWDEPASAQAMAPSADGARLYVVDSVRGVVSVMDTETLEILSTEDVAMHVPGAERTTAQVSADGSTLFVGVEGAGSDLYAIDTTTFEVTHRWPMAGDVSGLGLSQDGLRLFVALGDKVEVLDPATGGELGEIPLTSPQPVLEISALGA